MDVVRSGHVLIEWFEAYGWIPSTGYALCHMGAWMLKVEIFFCLWGLRPGGPETVRGGQEWGLHHLGMLADYCLAFIWPDGLNYGQTLQVHTV